ncbi:hypothetical protein AN218_14785 [Streptomyces nanshensis]|uniref:histidine kinase n=1 Tax=Streptomyces nanshensis TaxID=518642 RepID=A0A1E7L4D5_9ACTN|nr:hypothetical protein AN218_14785 [Streptomyces nanshensis]
MSTEGLPWAMQAWVKQLQVIIQNLPLNYVQLEERMGPGASTSTLSRIFTGRTLPSGPDFVDRLCAIIQQTTYKAVPQKTVDELRGLYFAALKERDPHRAEVEKLKRALEDANSRVSLAQEAASSLRWQLIGERAQLELPSSKAGVRSQDACSAAEVTPDDVLTRHERLDQELRELLIEVQQLSAARDEIDRQLKAAEDRLNARLAEEWAQAAADSDPPPRVRSRRRAEDRPALSPLVGDSEVLGQRDDQLIRILTETTQRALPLVGRLQDVLAPHDPAALLVAQVRRKWDTIASLTGESQPQLGPAWVPVSDVLKLAAAKIQFNDRVDLSTLDETIAAERVQGQAVTEVCNLLAELLENATTHSTPKTTVIVEGERGGPGSGLRLSIHDVGIGMPDDELALLNERLANPPVYASTRRLGILIVGNLAQRNEIGVELANRTTGGTTANVYLPEALLAPTPAGGADASVPGNAPELT